jgi:hypothetical protein
VDAPRPNQDQRTDGCGDGGADGGSVACFTIYDMLKAIDRTMVIEGVRLLEKRGGASGD